MDRTATGALLWGRASLLAFVAFFAGVVGHVSADGLLPSPLLLILLLALGIPFCASQLTRPASMRRIVLMLMAGQTAVHVALSVTAGHRGETRPATTVARSGDLVLPTEGGQRVGSLLDGYQATVGHAGDQVQPALPVGSMFAELVAHGPMMVAHLAAAAVVGIWLAVGERSLWALLALAATVVLRPLLVARAWLRLAVAPSRPAPVVDAPRALPSLVLLARCLSRRGPPALLA
jgi:hypothetical protein